MIMGRRAAVLGWPVHQHRGPVLLHRVPPRPVPAVQEPDWLPAVCAWLHHQCQQVYRVHAVPGGKRCNEPTARCRGPDRWCGTQTGQYQDTSGMSNCVVCPVGKYAPQAASACTFCELGKYSASNETVQCSDCPFGTFTREIGGYCCACSEHLSDPDPLLLQGKPCASTAAQAFSRTRRARVTVSPALPAAFPTRMRRWRAQWYGLRPTTGPPCRRHGDALIIALQCEPGSAQAQPGTSTCNLCDLGKFQGLSGTTTCNPCLKGEFANTAGSTACLGCPAVRCPRGPCAALRCRGAEGGRL